MTDTPSKAALDAAVKPAGMTWGQFNLCWSPGVPLSQDIHAIALAYAAHLDKADKQNREVLALMSTGVMADYIDAKAILRANLLPEPIDPDLLEAREMAAKWFDDYDGPGVEQSLLKAIKRGRELAKERSE